MGSVQCYHITCTIPKGQKTKKQKLEYTILKNVVLDPEMSGKCLVSPPLPKKAKEGKPSPHNQKVNRLGILTWHGLSRTSPGWRNNENVGVISRLKRSKASQDNGLAILVGTQEIFK